MHPCTLYEEHNCGNCAFQCAMEGDDFEKGCVNWKPMPGRTSLYGESLRNEGIRFVHAWRMSGMSLESGQPGLGKTETPN